MHTNQPPTFIKHQKSTKTTTTSKTFETKICKGVERVRRFTVTSMTNPYERFRSKKTRFAVYHVSKSYVITTSHKNVAKTESQQREELRFRTSESSTTCSLSTLLSLEQSLNNHFFRLKQKTNANLHLTRYSFYITSVQKNSKKLIEKHFRGHLRTQFTARKKKSFDDNLCKKNNCIKTPIKD